MKEPTVADTENPLQSPRPIAAPGPWTPRGTDAGAGDSQQPENSLAFDGNNDDIWPITLRIAILNLITLFFYRFWGRVRMRQYLWDRTSFLGDRLAYTGTGKELFIGFNAQDLF